MRDRQADRWSIRRRAGVMVLLVIPLLFVFQGRVTQAQTTIDPTIFAAPLSVVTAGGGSVHVNRVEDNATAATDPLYLRPSSTKTAANITASGRITGYEGEFDTGELSYAYTVSIYGSADQAAGAFHAQQSYWQTGGGQEHPVNQVGDPGLADWFAVAFSDSSGGTSAVAEGFFVRGRILIEVYVVGSQDAFNAAGAGAFSLQLALMTRLDGIAVTAQQVPATPTPTNTPVPTATATATTAPTATATATNTPSPTATATPSPTPTVTARRVITCKKGYRVVKGKCVKKKKGHASAAQVAALREGMSATATSSIAPQLAHLESSLRTARQPREAPGTVLRLVHALSAP